MDCFDFRMAELCLLNSCPVALYALLRSGIHSAVARVHTLAQRPHLIEFVKPAPRRASSAAPFIVAPHEPTH